MSSLRFYTKTVSTTSTSYAPLRINFILPSPSLSAGGTVTVVLPSSQYGYTNTVGWVCYFRSHVTDSYYTQSSASCTVSASPPLTIVATASAALAASVKHQLVVESLNNVLANDFAVYSSATANTFKITFSNSGTDVAYASNVPLYPYKPTHLAQPANFYITNIYSGNANTLITQISTTGAIAAYPNYLMEINFPSASSALIKFGVTPATRNIQCGVVGLAARSTYAPVRCVLVQSTIIKVRIENFDTIASGVTFSVMLYDLANNILAANSVAYLDINFVVKKYDFTSRYEGALLKMFTPTTGTFSPTTSTGDFPTHSGVTSYNTATTLSTKFGFTDTCSSGCRFMIRGTSTNYVFTNSFAIGGTAQSLTLFDTVNNILGIFF